MKRFLILSVALCLSSQSSFGLTMQELTEHAWCEQAIASGPSLYRRVFTSDHRYSRETYELRGEGKVTYPGTWFEQSSGVVGTTSTRSGSNIANVFAEVTRRGELLTINGRLQVPCDGGIGDFWENLKKYNDVVAQNRKEEIARWQGANPYNKQPALNDANFR